MLTAPNFYTVADQNIYNEGTYFKPQEQFTLPYNQVSIDDESLVEPEGILSASVVNNSGGNNFNSSFSNDPYTAKPSGSFVTNRTAYGTSGYLPETEPEPSKFQPAMDLIKKGIGMAIPGGNFLMGMAGKLDNFKNLSAQDKAFAEMQMANQEQSMYGGNLPNQDRYGYNKRSAFGNYANLVSKRADKAREWQKQNPGKELLDIHSYYLEKEKEGEDVKNQIDFNNFVRQRSIANKIREGIKKGTINEKFNIHNDAGDKTPPSDPGSRGRDDTPGFGKTAEGNYSNQFEGGDPGLMADGGRAGYFFGGRVNYEAGGRINFKGGGMDMGNESNQTQSANMGGGATGDFSTGEQTMNHNRAMRDNQKPPESPVKNIIDAGSEISYLNNLKNLNLPGLALNFGVNKFRNFIGNKKTKEEEDKLSYNTNTLPTNNYMAKVTKQDLARYTPRNQKELIDKTNYIDAKDQFLINPEMSKYEFEEMKKGNITEPGTYIGADGGRVYLVNGGLAGLL